MRITPSKGGSLCNREFRKRGQMVPKEGEREGEHSWKHSTVGNLSYGFLIHVQSVILKGAILVILIISSHGSR